MNRIPFFGRGNQPKEQDPEAAAQQQARTQQIADRIVQMAISLNSMITPGATITVDIKAGSILIPGRVNGSEAGCIIISKPIVIQGFVAQMQPPAEPKKEGGA